MSLTGKEIAQMHKDYVMQSWSKSGVDALPVERAEGIYFYDYDGKWLPCWYVQIWDMNFQRL